MCVRDLTGHAGTCRTSPRSRSGTSGGTLCWGQSWGSAPGTSGTQAHTGAHPVLGEGLQEGSPAGGSQAAESGLQLSHAVRPLGHLRSLQLPAAAAMQHHAAHPHTYGKAMQAGPAGSLRSPAGRDDSSKAHTFSSTQGCTPTLRFATAAAMQHHAAPTPGVGPCRPVLPSMPVLPGRRGVLSGWEDPLKAHTSSATQGCTPKKSHAGRLGYLLQPEKGAEAHPQSL